MTKTKTRKWFLPVLVAVAVLISLGAHADPPGWQCYPFAGVAEYTVDSCTGHAPVLAYLGDGQTVLVYFVVSLKVDSDINCFESHAGWSGITLGAQQVSGYGAATLQGEGLSFAATPGAPANQACLGTLRTTWPVVRVTKTRIDEDYILLTVETPSSE